jgi:hypothetical protein
MHGKQSLAYTKIRRDNLPLVRAAEKQFGSWGKALYAIGIDPSIYYVRHKWRESGRSVPVRAVNGQLSQMRLTTGLDGHQAEGRSGISGLNARRQRTRI